MQVALNNAPGGNGLIKSAVSSAPLIVYSSLPAHALKKPNTIDARTASNKIQLPGISKEKDPPDKQKCSSV
jgi:hypothetical protein